MNLFFTNLQKNNQSVFRNNFKIVAAEGCFPYSIWSTLRDLKYAEKIDMEKTLADYERCNININYVFDNGMITEENLKDTFSNLILELAHKKGNGVYVKSNLLYDYIKEEYPLYKVIKIADFNELNKNNIAISPELNNKFKKSDVKYRQNAYITLNPFCPSDCKHYKEHKKYIEHEQQGFFECSDIYLCPLKKEFDFYSLKNHPNFISIEKMQEYINMGFNNFRIDFPLAGTCANIRYGIYDLIESYIYYLIKEEYQQKVRHDIIKETMGSKDDRIQFNYRQQPL